MTARPKWARVQAAQEWNSRLSRTEYLQRRLTFGQHAGVMIQDLPLDYIKWGIMNLDQDWAGFLARELQRRDKSYK